MVNLVWNEEDAYKSYFAQGKEEGRLELVKNLLKEKMSFDFIARVTGSDKEEILKIANEQK